MYCMQIENSPSILLFLNNVKYTVASEIIHGAIAHNGTVGLLILLRLVVLLSVLLFFPNKV